MSNQELAECQVDWLGLALDLEQQAKRVGSQTVERAMIAAAHGLRLMGSRASKDAERYRWLRQQNWNEAVICCVANPKEAVKLGHDCPSLDRLDAAIDSAIAALAAKGKQDE